MTQFILGLALGIFISYLAYLTRSLNKSGALAAALIGTIVLGFGGWQWAILLLMFFITSSVFSKTFKKHKQGLDKKYSKGNQRDAQQVLGNGGLASIFVLLHILFPNESWPWLGFSASLAAVNADTWATELGALNPGSPRLITKINKVVEKGTSGAISLFGTIASFGGAALIGILASFLQPAAAPLSIFITLTLAGFCGSLFDSFLGATIQALYFCTKDNQETEQHPLHSCGTPTTHIHGWKWMNNDVVNVACGTFGVLINFLMLRIFKL